MTLSKTVTKIITNTTIAASSYTDSTTYLDTNTAVGLAIEGYCINSSISTSCARLQGFGSYDSTTWDTDPFWYADMPFSSGTTNAVSQTFEFPAGPRYIKIRMLNTSTLGNVGAIDVWSHLLNST